MEKPFSTLRLSSFHELCNDIRQMMYCFLHVSLALSKQAQLPKFPISRDDLIVLFFAKSGIKK